MTPTATRAPPRPQLEQLPPPVAGKTVNVSAARARCLSRSRGSNKFVELKRREQIPVGRDDRHPQGPRHADLRRRRKRRDADRGLLRAASSRSARPGRQADHRPHAGREARQVPEAAGSASAAAKKKKTRKLWGERQGRFRTSGQYSAATVRGTDLARRGPLRPTLTKVTTGHRGRARHGQAQDGRWCARPQALHGPCQAPLDPGRRPGRLDRGHVHCKTIAVVCARAAAPGSCWRLPSRRVAALACPRPRTPRARLLDGAPLNVFVDGLGAIQVRVRTASRPGLFYDPDENPAPRGARDQGGRAPTTRSRTASTTRGRARRRRDHAERRAAPARARCSSNYTVGPNLRVTETITYTDGSPRSTSTTRSRTSPARRLDPRRRARGPLRRQQRQRQRRDLERRAAVRRRARRGHRARLRPAGDHALGGAPGGRLRARVRQLLRVAGSTTRSTRRRPTTASASSGGSTTSRPGEVPRDRRPLAAGRRPRRPARSSPGSRRASQGGVLPPPVVGQERQRRASARAGSSTGSRRARSTSSSRTRKQLPIGAIFDTTQGPREPDGRGRQGRHRSSPGSTTASSRSARRRARSR